MESNFQFQSTGNKRLMTHAQDPDISCSKLLNLFRWFNTLMGIPVFVVPQSGIPLKILSIYQRIGDGIVLVGVIGQFWAVPHVYEDMNILCACLASGVHSLSVLLKTILLRTMKTTYEEHIRNTDEVLSKYRMLAEKISKSANSRVTNFDIFHQKEAGYVRALFLVLFTMYMISTSSYFIPLTYESIQKKDNIEGLLPPIVFYFHFDYMYTPALQIVNLFLTVCFYLNNSKTIVLDSFILAFIVLHTMQFRYLKNLLNAIIDQRQSANPCSPTEECEIMSTWLRVHQTTLRVAEDFAKIMSPYLLVQFVYIFTHTCVPSFVITSTSSWTIAQKSGVFFIVGSTFVELFFMSKAGDEMTKSIQETTEKLYCPKVCHTNEKWHRHVYLMTALRARIPFVLKAVDVYPLCCSSFVSLSRLIVSYYITLNEVQRRKADMDIESN